MKFESTVVGVFAIALSASASMAFVRSEEEFARRSGLNGTRLHPASDGRSIEFSLDGSFSGSRPVLVLENGLGSSLESWDWIRHLLREHFDIVRYHRRGYGRTKSVLRPARMLEELLTHYAETGPVAFAAHSFGALVTANALEESGYLRDRATAVCVIDGTDEELLRIDRSSPTRSGRFRQTILQEALSSITGMNRWVTSNAERDVEYRPDVQRSVLVTGSLLRTYAASLREYLHEPLGGQRALAELDLARTVLAAADNSQQQAGLAHRIRADLSTVPNSSHRSIIGKIQCAQFVADAIRSVAHAS
jgi:pimeloyl-ACP methyl ester carboxylesterase